MPRGQETDLSDHPTPAPPRRTSARIEAKVPSGLSRRFIEASIEFVRFPRREVRERLTEPTFMIVQGFDHQTREQVIIKGNMLVGVGDAVIRAEGEFKYDVKYGWSFNARRVDLSAAAHRDAVRAWLAEREQQLDEAQLGRIAAAWGEQAADKLTANPYAICELGIDFATADRIGRAVHVDALDLGRLRAAAGEAFRLVDEEGDCRISQQDLVRLLGGVAETAELRGAKPAAIKALHAMVKRGTLVQETDANGDVVLYQRETWELECATAQLMQQLLQREATEAEVPKVRSRGRFRLTREQREAVELACSVPIGVVTGGPGVGKTSVLLAACEALEQMGQRYALAAPTGKAAKRMIESTEREAQTLHRLLGWKYVVGEDDDVEPLGVDAVIVDESSMIDLRLMERLLGRIGPDTRLILVGDVDQLPPVGAGSVFRDVIASGAVPCARLTKTFRQGAGSLLLTNAQRVRDGKEPFWTAEQAEAELGEPVRRDFEFVDCERAERAAEHARQLVDQTPGAMLLSASRAGKAGVHALNRQLQAEHNNAGAPICETEAYQLRVGDQVLITRNDYGLGVVNGDMGQIVNARLNNSVLDIMVDGRLVEMGRPQAEQVVDLGYALTVHKSQGSQAPTVICPIGTDAAGRMLSRNLLYTAWTRGQKRCVVIGPKSAVRKALTVDGTKRQTGLAERIAAAQPAS